MPRCNSFDANSKIRPTADFGSDEMRTAISPKADDILPHKAENEAGNLICNIATDVIKMRRMFVDFHRFS